VDYFEMLPMELGSILLEDAIKVAFSLLVFCFDAFYKGIHDLGEPGFWICYEIDEFCHSRELIVNDLSGLWLFAKLQLSRL
jgi:hypothetical protein